jgi:hypothetical protein
MKSILSGPLFCLIGLVPLVAGHDPGREDKVAVQTEGGASKNNQIEVKTDRFSNKTTLVLKPQPLIDKPDHFVTLIINTEVMKSDDPLLKVSLYSMVHVASQARVPPDFGDSELHFLVDDKPLDIKYNTISDYPMPLESKYYIEKHNLRFKRTYSYFAFDSAYESLSKAENIEMRLGPFELKLNQQVTANLREYARQVLEARNKLHPGNNKPKGAERVVTASVSPVELKFWESIEKSNDPKDFEAYIRKYPNGHFADLANNRIKSLGSSNGASAPANATPEAPIDNPSNKDEQPQTLKFKLGHQHGGAFSSSFHEGFLSISPQKIQWEEIGLMSDRDDNFSVSCSDITGVHVNLREGEPKPETTVADHEYIRLELKDSALNRKGRKRYSFPVIDISDKESIKAAGEAIKRACPDLKIKANKFSY